MEVMRKIFEKLVTNEYMRDLNYVKHTFSFKTVFYTSAYSYCCCSCAYEHEYLDYISDCGEIDDDVYDKIVDSIMLGKCPHTDGVPKEFIRVTAVSGVHIAAAVGTFRVISDHLDDFTESTSEIFQLKLHHIALIKRRYLLAILYYKICKESDYMYYLSRSDEMAGTFRIDKLAYLEACVKENDKHLLKGVLSLPIRHDCQFAAFDDAIKHCLTDLQDCFLKHFTQSNQSSITPINYLDTAILYDQPQTLDNIMNCGFFDKNQLPFRLIELCILLNRHECKNILSKYMDSNEIDTPAEVKFDRLLNILDYFHGEFYEEIMTVLKRISNIQPNVIKTYLETLIISKPNFKETYLKVKAVLELGRHIGLDTDIEPLFMFMVENLNLYGHWVREVLKLLINENPDTTRLMSAVNLGILRDRLPRLQTLNQSLADISGTYHTDCKEHGLFVSADQHDFALNFIGSFFIECGFPVRRYVLLDSLTKQLHPAELAYIQNCLDTPKPLTVNCRNALRTHLKGHKIHRFVDAVECPSKLKDFILLKDLLARKEE